MSVLTKEQIARLRGNRTTTTTDLLDTIATLQARVEGLEGALRRIAKGETLPECKGTHPDPIVALAQQIFGSAQTIARAALAESAAGTPAKPTPADRTAELQTAIRILLEGNPGAAQNAVREDYPQLAVLVDNAMRKARLDELRKFFQRRFTATSEVRLLEQREYVEGRIAELSTPAPEKPKGDGTL